MLMSLMSFMNQDMIIIFDCFVLDAFDGFDYFSFCIFTEKYKADDDVMKHVLKEKVSYCF